MKFLLIAKRNFYTIQCFKKILEEKNIPFDYANYTDIKIQNLNNKFQIFIKNTDIKEYTHVIARRHSNDTEFNIRYILAKYCQDKDIKMLNSNVLFNMPVYNKLYQMYLFCQNNIPYLPSYHFSNGLYTKPLIDYPIVIKRYIGRAGKMVFLIEDEQQLNNFLKKNRFRKQLIFQTYSPVGEDFRLMIVDRKVFGGWKRKSNQNFKTTSHGNYSLYNKPSEDLLQLGNKIGKLLNIDYGAVDIIYYKNKPYVLEVNLDAGFKVYHETLKSPNNLPQKIIENFISN